ncbi:MAG TPA: TIGR04255 family protein [Capsulimonadaceae bacterium]|nr:TIGR04255 family protein [Capsulimonadaceae bacterium]
MADYPVLRNAPIVEAVLNIGLPPNAGVTLSQLEQIGSRIKSRFPVRQERRNVGLHVSAGPHGILSLNQEAGKAVGFVYSNPESAKAVQIRLDGFSFSKLKPYSQWDEFYPEAMELWNLYLEETRTPFVSLFSLRYINQLDLPLPCDDFSEYLQTYPEIAKGIPQMLASFALQFVVPSEDQNVTARVQFRSDALPADAQRIPMFFDIDAFKSQQFPSSSSEINSIFEVLRNYKNRIFFSSLTERAIGLYK